MDTMEKARIIRNLYNRWLDFSKQEKGQKEILDKFREELSKATYSKNGYSHFKTIGSWANREEALRQEKYMVEKYTHVVRCRVQAEIKLHDLLEGG